MEQVTIIGTGTMGHSIALSVAWADFPVTIYGLNNNEIQQAITGVENKTSVLIEHGMIDNAKMADIKKMIHFSKDLQAATKDATFIIEAAPENLELKQQLFREIESYCSDETILASNSSSLEPTKIAKSCSHPERVLNTHFWNPAHIIPLVEIVRGEQTADVYIERAQQFLEAINKQPIVVQKEVVGFVGNRLQFALFREAQYLFETGVASLEDIDKAVELSIGRRLGVTGPFKTADLGGLDVFQAISDNTFQDLSNNTSASESINQHVSNGDLGAKTGQGYYNWTNTNSSKIQQAREQELIRWLKKDQSS